MTDEGSHKPMCRRKIPLAYPLSASGGAGTESFIEELPWPIANMDTMRSGVRKTRLEFRVSQIISVVVFEQFYQPVSTLHFILT